MAQVICEDHECDLCDQAQKLMEQMNDKCVRYEQFVEIVTEQTDHINAMEDAPSLFDALAVIRDSVRALRDIAGGE